MKYLALVVVFCLTGTVFAQEPIHFEGILVDRRMLVEELPPRLIGQTLTKDFGDLVYKLDPDSGEMLYQHNGEEVSSIDLPDEFNSQWRNTTTSLPNSLQLEICNFPSNLDDPISFGQKFMVDFTKQTINHVGDCRYVAETWGGGGESYSSETTSPDELSIVSTVRAGQPDANCFGNVVVLVESSAGVNIADCPYTEGVSFEGWLDNERLLMRYFSPRDSTPPIEELVVLTTSTGEVTSLGTEIENYPSGFFFFANNTKIMRIAIRNIVQGEIRDCALEAVDLTDYKVVELEQTFCPHSPKFLVNEVQSELLYLNHQVNSNPNQPTTTLNRVDLETLDVTPLLPTGTIIQPGELSPDGDQLELVLDASPEALVTPSWGGGEIAWGNPRWMIYDLSEDQIIFEKPLLETADGMWGQLYFEGIGTPGFEWTDNGWHTLFITDNKEQPPLLIESANNTVIETRLSGIPGSESYGAIWSSDNSHLLISLENDARYVVNTDDYSVIQVTQAVELDDFRLSLTWYGEENVLLAELLQFGAPVTVGRWLIDPSAVV